MWIVFTDIDLRKKVSSLELGGSEMEHDSLKSIDFLSLELYKQLLGDHFSGYYIWEPRIIELLNYTCFVTYFPNR